MQRQGVSYCIRIFLYSIVRMRMCEAVTSLDSVKPSIAQLVERWTVVGLCIAVIHRSLVRIRLEGILFILQCFATLSHFLRRDE